MKRQGIGLIALLAIYLFAYLNTMKASAQESLYADTLLVS